MKILLAGLLMFLQAARAPDKWECRGEAEPLSKEGLRRIKSGELRERVVSCAVPRLPGNVDAQGTVIVEVHIDEDGSVRCARVLAGGQHPIMRRAALDAAKRWRFEPLKVGGQAKPYVTLLPLVVHWNGEEAGKQCPKEKRELNNGMH